VQTPCNTRTRWIGALLLALAVAGAAFGAPPEGAKSLDLSKYQGRVVIVDFWASWCKPCRQSIPWLNAMRARYGANGLTIIGINLDAERADADRFLRDVPIEFDVIFDPNGEIARQFDVQAMPTSYFFDRAGRKVQMHLGFRDAKKSENEAALKKLLGVTAP
jgi:cytochrome c biogenesis protein CcmG, thiol:disulfide interchange protein DsbE